MLKLLGLLLVAAAANASDFDCELKPSDRCPEIGDKIHLTCDCDTDPSDFYVYDKPNWRWWSSEKKLSLKVVHDHFGRVFECWAKDNDKKSNDYFQTRIYKRPSIQLQIDPNEVMVGEPFTLIGTVNNPGNVNYIVKFFQTNGNIVLFGVQDPQDPNRWTATVNSATKAHEGFWVAQIWSSTCNADYNSPKEELKVFRIPKIDLVFTTNSVTEGSPTTATITVNNPDQAPITRVELKDPSGTVRATFTNVDDPVEVLTYDILEADLTDEGTWTAVIIGEETPDFDPVETTEPLVVDELPKVTLSISPNPVFELDPFDASWVITNDENVPITKVVLIDPQGNEIVVTNDPDSSLTFPQAEPEHDGDWKVVITVDTTSGPKDIMSNIVDLVVKERPDEVFYNDCNKKYRMVYKRRTHQQASNYCDNQGMILAPVLDDLEIQKVAAATPANNKPYHVGYKRNGNGWRANNCAQNVIWSNDKVVNHNQNNKKCLYVTSNQKKRAGFCNTKRFFLCMEPMDCAVRDQYPVISGSKKYYAINWLRTQSDAQHYCEYIDDGTGGLMTINNPGEMQEACQPLIDQGLANQEMWTAPTSPDGTTYESCGFTIPQFWFSNPTKLFDNSNAGNVSGTRCTALVLDVYNVFDCGDCHRFFCEVSAC